MTGVEGGYAVSAQLRNRTGLAADDDAGFTYDASLKSTSVKRGPKSVCSVRGHWPSKAERGNPGIGMEFLENS